MNSKDKLKQIKSGMRLDIKKAPKVEIPKSVYSRKMKYKKNYEE